MIIIFVLLASLIPTFGVDVCYPGMSCYAHEHTNHVEESTKTPAVETKPPQFPNYMIPVWKDRMYDAGNNESYMEMISVLNEGGPRSVLIAYHGCKIVNILSHYKREVAFQ